jgi:methionyl-tRNA synthetase
MPDTPNKFYLTTPIYYVNARPHIGHAYSTIAADVIARRHRLLGDDTFFLTGTDEHGQKVQRSAEKAGIPPHQFTDEVSATFRNLWKRMGITNDDYIRTTEERHKRGVQHLWKVLEQNGAIYLDSYTGAYCVSDEAFVDLPAGTPCPDCGRPLEIVTEENYFFKLSEYQARLIDLIESGTLHIQPETTKNEVLSFLRGGLKDLSISRTTFDWGIPVPGNPKHVIYVWLDALANYITAMGYGAEDRDDLTPAQKQEEKAKFEKYWPADIHLVGKEITRFHCVYWPAFLMAAGLPTPKSVVANGWLLFEESKMSKSRGNVVRTETILDAFGDEVYGKQFPDSTKAERDLFASDVIRYFLLREIPFGQDGSFSFDALITRYNADLANGYGNLVSRTLNMIKSYFDEDIPHPTGSHASDGPLESSLAIRTKMLQVTEAFEQETDSFNFSNYLTQVAALVAETDRFLSEEAPWKMAKVKDEISRDRLQRVLYVASSSIHFVTVLLYPIMPYATASVWRQLGLGSIEQAAQNGDLKNLQWGGLKPGTKLGPLAPIFPRADKGLAQTMTDMENPTTPAPELSPEAKASEPTAEALNAVSPDASASPVAPAATPHPATPAPPTITIDDFAKIDLRVAQIVVAERIPKADKLLRLEVDLGTERRQILSGIAEFYTPEELIGKRIAIIANLAPRKMRGLESHGMLLAASGEDHSIKPILATFGEEIALGSKIR